MTKCIDTEKTCNTKHYIHKHIKKNIQNNECIIQQQKQRQFILENTLLVYNSYKLT